LFLGSELFERFDPGGEAGCGIAAHLLAWLSEDDVEVIVWRTEDDRASCANLQGSDVERAVS